MAEGQDPGATVAKCVRPPSTPTLRELSNELDLVVDWHSLGVKLGLEGHELHMIDKNYRGDNTRCKHEMLDHWLKNDKHPTWKAVADALYGIRERAVAWKIQNEHCSSPDTEIPSAAGQQDPSNVTVAIAQSSIQKIKGKFSMLVTETRRKLQSRKVDIEDVQTFLVTLYSSPKSKDGNDTITTVVESAETLAAIFRALSKCGLWDYLNYYLLQNIIENFAYDDNELNDMMDQYQKDLTGYILTLRIQTYLDATHYYTMSDSENSADEIVTTLQPEEKDRLFKKLKVKVKANVTDDTLSYVTDLWRSLAHQFVLPQPALILNDIAEGCISITWLIPTNLLMYITRMGRETANMFSRKHVLSVLIENQYIYPMETELPPLDSETAAPIRKDNPRKESAADQTTCNYGGYDCEFVSPPPEFLETNCSICLLVFRKPMQTSCGHIFCESCIENLQKESCPECKKELSTYYDKRLQQSLNELQVRCSHQKTGCNWTGELRELDSHLSTQCEFSNTSAEIPPILEKQPSHLPDKQDKQIGEQKMQPSMDEKQKTQELSLKALPSHRKSNFLVDHHFTMNKFELHKRNNAEWNSEPFYTHHQGYKMCIRIDANGYDEERGNYVSLYTCLMKGDYDNYLHWPFHGEIAVELLNQNADEWGEGGHHKCTIRYDDSTHDCAQKVLFDERSRGVGKPKFISHSELNPKYNSKVQYLRNDCLNFRLSVLHVELPELHGSGKLLEYEPVDSPSSITS